MEMINGRGSEEYAAEKETGAGGDGAVREAETETVFTRAELDEAVAAALKRVTTGVPFAPMVKAARNGVEEAFYRQNPQLRENA
jgi:hypothetical protein